MSVLDNKYSFAIAEAITVGGTFDAGSSPVALTRDTDVSESSKVPFSCYLDSLELELSGISDGDKVTVYLARDAAGNVPLTSAHLDGATQRVTVLTGGSTTGGCNFQIHKEFHFDSTVSGATAGTLYLAIKCVDSGGVAAPCTADARLNWRA
tara:strand:- start:666 stop:1121 length:456 start_codon:yes stop_codon:yes gene_type:complete